MLKTMVLALGILGMSATSSAQIYSSICLGNQWINGPITFQVKYGSTGQYTNFTLFSGQWRTLSVTIPNDDYEDYFYVRYDENRGPGTNYVVEEVESALTPYQADCDDSYVYEFKYDSFQSNFISLYEVF